MDFVETLRDLNPDGGGWRAPDVCQMVGCSYRQLDYWCRTGLIEADIQVARGSGSQRLFSNEMVVQLWIIVQLLEAGVSLRRIRRWGPVETVVAFAGRLAELEGVLLDAGLLTEGSDQEGGLPMLDRSGGSDPRASVSSLLLVGA